MARRNANLAGLAALGALGYKLAQGKGAPVEDRMGTPVSKDDQDFAAMDASMATMRPQRGNQLSEDVMSDEGTPSGLRRNLETGDLYNPNMTAAPVRTPRKTSAPVAKTPDEPKADAGMSNEDIARIRAGKPRGRYVAGAAPKTTVGKTYAPNPAGLKDEDVPMETFTMKKGGKVKKMASGGMAKAQKPAAKGWGKARGARGAKYY
jgi:hypothetical protein